MKVKQIDLHGLPSSLTEAKLDRKDKYYTGRPCLNGHLSWRYAATRRCSECARESGRNSQSKWRKANLVTYKANDLRQAARQRANKLGVPFNLSSSFVREKLAAGVCERTGLPLDIAVGKRTPFSASLDRTVPGVGYVESNVEAVVWVYNAAKGEGSHEDVLAFASAVLAAHTTTNIRRLSS